MMPRLLTSACLAILLFPSDEFGEQERPTSEIPAFVKQFLPVNEVRV